MSAPQKGHPSSAQDEQQIELHAPVDDDGWHSSQVRDWVGVCPELSDSAIRLYMILRALVIEKRGPVRKLTLWELCHLLPRKPVGPGERPEPSSVSRIRNLLRELTHIGLVTTPEGHRVTTSSRALAAGRGLRMRINLMPVKSYQGPRNVFEVLDGIREAAEESARQARVRELELAAQKRAEKAAADAGQKSNPGGAGQISDPLGQISNPSGQISDPDSGADLEDREPPLRLSAQTFRSDVPPPVRPSVQVVDVRESQAPSARTDGRGGGIEVDQEEGPVPAGDRPQSRSGETGSGTATASEPGAKTAATAGGVPTGAPVRVDHGSRGVRLLTQAADRETLADLRVRGTALRDQGLMVDGLLEAGHSPWTIHEVIALPMPDPITTSRSAVISGRLRRLAATPPILPPVTATPPAPQQTPAPGPVPGPRWEEAPTPTPPPVAERLAAAPAPVDCAGDDGLCPRLAVIGETLCAAHLDWPLCPGHDGRPCTTRTRTGDLCAICEHHALAARLDAELPVTETEDGTCPGHTGPCGRPVVAEGLCLRCRVASQTDRDRIEREWRAARAAAVAAVAAEEGHRYDQEHHDHGQKQPVPQVPGAEDARRAAAFAFELDEEDAYREAAARAEQQYDLDRAARQQAEDEETARIRAELAAQYPDLAAVSASAREGQDAQQPAAAPF
ncbi:hypothetical protein [Streptomyces sp. B27]|uniref:hypothetical protein n=1 Tax=Streptomyces sp. B27 TaxID=2485015 RepID=UPI000FD8B626|nr:hypothetical protein [Streptomyces sp. B27]